ncbi:MAG: NADPH-dependent assimilatory sulfite reductase hemoprotein subunit [Acidimicrobiales bacterium]
MTIERTLTVEEEFKRASGLLRGDLADQLGNVEPTIAGPSEHLLKFHGIYAQDNRDVRRERTLAGQGLEHIFMVRVAIPGGHLSSGQWLALDAVAGEIADGSIRLTTRQAVQFHGVLKQGLRPVATRLNQHLMTSFAACGDVVRNTVMCPSLLDAANNARLIVMADHLARTFKPATRAHWEIFVNSDKVASSEPDAEHDFYGATYLPRKFKIAIASTTENCVDILAQDLGLVPMVHDELGEGFTVVVAGGLGRSYANPDTFARLADPLTFVTYDEVDDLIRAVLGTYRDLGDRTNRRRARMKYVAADAGAEGFRREIEQRFGRALREPLPLELSDADDHLGWRERADGTWQLGVRVGAGRVRDDDEGRGLRSALREIAQVVRVDFLITAQQDIVISSIAPGERDVVAAVLAVNGVRSVEDLGAVERSALACPALPTCGQALAEAERCLDDVVAMVQDELDERGLKRRPLQLRMTGCPNGCARPAVAEVGIVGRTKNTYDLFLGGGPRGDRLAVLHQEKIKLDELPAVLRPLLERWKLEGRPGEAFGDFYVRSRDA